MFDLLNKLDPLCAVLLKYIVFDRLLLIGPKLKRLSQKRLDEEIRTRVADGKGGKNPRKNLKIMRTNSTLPTLQRLTAATVARRRGHKKKHSQRGNLVNFVQTTKELTLSGENESESRSYNYDPTYPVYNYQAPTESGEDIMSNFGMVKVRNAFR